MTNKEGQILKPLIHISDDINACWEWQGKINKENGYGHKQLAGKTVLAHRWVHSIFNGHIPENMVIDHLCGNRSCVNPKHLEVVNQAENVRRCKATKLSKKQVVEIKQRLVSAKWGDRKKIAEEFGVSEQLISDIKYGRAWADI